MHLTLKNYETIDVMRSDCGVLPDVLMFCPLESLLHTKPALSRIVLARYSIFRGGGGGVEGEGGGGGDYCPTRNLTALV